MLPAKGGAPRTGSTRAQRYSVAPAPPATWGDLRLAAFGRLRGIQVSPRVPRSAVLSPRHSRIGAGPSQIPADHSPRALAVVGAPWLADTLVPGRRGLVRPSRRCAR